MVNMASLTGLMCRILLLTSVAYEDTNQITVEFSTPRTNPPSSMFFCFTSTNFAVTSSTIDILRMTEGGTIFSTNETVVVLGPYYSSQFFTLSTYDLNPIEVSTVYEVLATDPYYAGSYNLQRYDDLTRDQQGISISGMVDFPVVTSAEAGDPPQSGNCFLLTGAWKANSRYQMTILLKNPPPPASVEVPWPPPPPSPRPPPPSPRANNSSKPPSPSPPPPYSSPTAPSFLTRIDNSTPILWMAPITHTVGSGQELLFSVRGSKYGAACPLRPAIEPYMSTMFDACTESRKRGLGPAENTSTNVTTCLQLLRSVANQTANRGALPFTAPPLTTYNLSSFPATSCTAANSALGPRFGSECISCGVYGVKQNSTCVCPRGILPNLVGSVACGEPISPDGNVTSLAALPEWLCRTLSSAKQSWQTKQLLDHNVAKQYVDAFTQLASPLLDQATVAAAFQEFNSTLIFDERRPDSPTRRYGIKPNCDECTNGQFKDAFSKRMTPLFDWHFDAMNTFRFLGYLLDKELQSPCPFLWDSSKPKDWSYGYYDEVICKPMPPGTCCGSNFEGT